MDIATSSVIEQFTTKIKQYFNPEYVVLFGSYSREEQKEFSEVFSGELIDEHRIMIQHVNERIHKHEGLQKVMAGDNSE